MPASLVEGALCAFLFHTDGRAREGADEQVPCRIVTVKSERPELQNTVFSVLAGNLIDSGINWTAGKEREVKGSDIVLIYDGTEGRKPGARARVPNWDFEKLHGLRDTAIDVESAWARMVKSSPEQSNSITKLFSIANAIYGESKFSAVTAWASWLHVSHGIHWCFRENQFFIRTAEEIEERKAASQADIEIGEGKSALGQNEKRIKIPMTREGKARLAKVSLSRVSKVYSVMSDKEINSLVSKSTLLQVEKDEILLQQGSECELMYTIVIGELDAIIMYGEGANTISKAVQSLQPGMTFGDDGLIDSLARITVKANRTCELGVVKIDDSKIILGQNLDLKTSLSKNLEARKPVIDLLMQKSSELLQLLGEQEIKYISKHMKTFRVKKDHSLFEQGDKGDSMFLVIDGFVALYNTLPETKGGNVHALRTAYLDEGKMFEEACLVLSKPRSSSAVLLAGSAVGEITRSDLSSILFRNPNISITVDSFTKGQSSVTFVAEALMNAAPSALFRILPVAYKRKLALKSQMVEYNAGDLLISQGEVSRAIFLIVDGFLEVSIISDGVGTKVGVLSRGDSVGEFGTLVATRATSSVICLGTTCVIEIPFEAVDIIVFNLPDIVDDVHEIKAIAGRRNFCYEMQPTFLDEVMSIFQQESAEADPKVLGKSSSVPFYSLWENGEKIEVVELSPSIFGAVPSSKGRYERSDMKLSYSPFKAVYRAYDSLWKMEVAWNQVFLKKMSSSLRMQFLEEVSTLLKLTNDKPSRMQYDIVEDRYGTKRALLAWELSQASQGIEEPKAMVKISSSSATITGQVGLPQADFESSTGVEAWRALRPFATEAPNGWYYDGPVKFMSPEEQEALRARRAEGRVLHAPQILKCFNQWEDEGAGVLTLITEVARPGAARKAFTCLNLGNVDPSVFQASLAQAGLGAEARRAVARSFSLVSASDAAANEARRAASR